MRKLFLAAVLAIGATAFSTTASATLHLTLSDGTNTVNVVDNGQPFLSFSGAIGNWNINVTTGSVGVNPTIDLNSINRISGTTFPSTLTITFSATNFTDPFATTFDSTIGGTLATGHSLTYNAYVDPNNGLGVMASQIGNTLSFGPGGGFSGSTVGGSVPANHLYSLTQVVAITATQAGGSSFDASLNAVPEPATVTMLGGILLATFGALRRRQKQS